MAQKKEVQVAIRFSDSMLKLTNKMMSQRKAASFPDYLRGLILLDAGEEDGSLILGHDIPGWVTTDNRYWESMGSATKEERKGKK